MWGAQASRRWTWHTPNWQHHCQIDYIQVQKRYKCGINRAKTGTFTLLWRLRESRERKKQQMWPKDVERPWHRKINPTNNRLKVCPISTLGHCQQLQPSDEWHSFRGPWNKPSEFQTMGQNRHTGHVQYQGKEIYRYLSMIGLMDRGRKVLSSGETYSFWSVKNNRLINVQRMLMLQSRFEPATVSYRNRATYFRVSTRYQMTTGAAYER